MARRILQEAAIILVMTLALLALTATAGVPRIPPSGSAEAAVSFEESLIPAWGP